MTNIIIVTIITITIIIITTGADDGDAVDDRFGEVIKIYPWKNSITILLFYSLDSSSLLNVFLSKITIATVREK